MHIQLLYSTEGGGWINYMSKFAFDYSKNMYDAVEIRIKMYSS